MTYQQLSMNWRSTLLGENLNSLDKVLRDLAT
jgi:hypothetical protein